MSLRCLSALVLALTLSLSALPAHAKKEGGSSGGGGQGLVYPDGSVRFLDLVTDQELPLSAGDVLDRQGVTEKLIAPKRYVKQLAHKESGFFDCARRKLYDSKIPLLVETADKLKGVPVYAVEFLLGQALEEDVDELNSKQPLFGTVSRRLSVRQQHTLAVYANKQLWLSGRLYARLSETDQCALAVHESLRHLNYMMLSTRALSTEDIEALTTAIMSDKLDTSTRGYEKLTASPDDFHSAMEEEFDLRAKLLLIDMDLRMNERPHRTITNPSRLSPEKVAELTAKKAELELQLEYTSARFNRAFYKELDLVKVRDIYDDLRNNTSTSLTDKLPFGKKYDLITLKVVSRIF